MQREDFAFFHTLRVRWAEVDYFDCAVTEYMRAIGFPYPDGFAAHGCDTFAVNASANFRAPARYDDVLDVGVAVSEIGRTSFRCTLAIHRGDDLLVDGALVYVAGSLAERRPVLVPQAFIERVTAHEKLAPARK